MENSDSEYFESADEDVHSDDENTKRVRSVKKSADNVMHASEVTAIKLDNLTLGESNLDANLLSLDNNKNKNNPNTDDENNICKIRTIKHESAENVITETVTASTQKEAVVAGQQQSKNEAKIVSSEAEDNLWDESEIDWGNEDNAWSNNDWEPIIDSKERTPEKEAHALSSDTIWSSWGNWGVSSIISTATQGVSSLTQGITNVLETGIGVPDPEELAKVTHAEEKVKEIRPPDNGDNKSTNFGLGNLVLGVSHFTKLVETTGTKVISGGLDTLETIGKKTMEVLQDGDPGLKKKRAFLKIESDKPVLSQLLREAKEKAEHENKILTEKHLKMKNYETLFDDHQGLIHLEALEMLSKQCDIKLQTMLESYTDQILVDMQETMDQVKELCELPDEDEEEHPNLAEISTKLTAATSEINIPISYKNLIISCEETETWLDNLKLEVCNERELHQQAIHTLAQLTAMAVEQFHKAGELLLVKEHRSTADEADSLVQLTTTLTYLIGMVAAKFSDKLNARSSNSKSKEEINGLITNVFFEAANSSSYIQDAFQLLIPVLQVGAV